MAKGCSSGSLVMPTRLIDDTCTYFPRISWTVEFGRFARMHRIGTANQLISGDPDTSAYTGSANKNVNPNVTRVNTYTMSRRDAIFQIFLPWWNVVRHIFLAVRGYSGSRLTMPLHGISLFSARKTENSAKDLCHSPTESRSEGKLGRLQRLACVDFEERISCILF